MKNRIGLCALLLWLMPSSLWAQPGVPVPMTGILVSANDAATASPSNAPSVTVQLSGTWSGTVTFEGSANGGANYVSVLATSVTDGSTATTATANGAWVIANGGYDAVRARFSTATSGGVQVSITRGYAQVKLASPVYTNAIANAFCVSNATKDSYVAEVAANDIGLYTNGTNCSSGTVRLDVNSTRALFAVPAYMPNGTIAAPSYAWTAEPELGFLRSAANTVQFGADGVGEVVQFNNSTGIAVASNLSVSFSDNVYVNSGTVDTTITRAGSGTLGFQAISLTGKATKYNNIISAGWGLPAIQAEGNAVAVVNGGTASIAAYTVGAADGTFEVGCNILITVSTNHTFSCDTTYTDEGNTARTMVMPVEQLAGTFATSGLMTNITGAGPYESPVMTIRAKAGTAITVRTSAGGTFTTVTYNARGIIKQVG